MSRARGWCFTLNNYLDRDIDYLRTPECRAKTTYLIYGREIAPDTGTPHLQGYVRFNNAIGLNTASKWLTRAHFEIAKGTGEQNRTYCSKGGDFEEYGSVPKQGERNDIKVTKEIVNNGGTMPEVIEKATSYQAMRCGELMMKYTKPPVRDPPKVLWFWGPTGTGKTRTAVEIGGDDFWISGDNLTFWDGYTGQKTIIIDDFRESFCSTSTLLRILDRYPYRVNIKQSSLWLRATTVIITCPDPPTKISLKGECQDQLLRRITEIREFSSQLTTEINCTEVKGNTGALTSKVDK